MTGQSVVIRIDRRSDASRYVVSTVDINADWILWLDCDRETVIAMLARR